jgi:NarL family two-component system response regulator LiaR
MTDKPKAPGNVRAPIRVLIVDDHAGVRDALASFLRAFDDLELAGEATLGEKAIPLCAQRLPDVVLMDLVMPGMSGVEATRIIRRRWPQIRIIALTSFQEIELAQQALDAGAVCCLLKNVSAAELAKAIRESVQDPPARGGSGSTPCQNLDAYVDPGLTPRERAVLALMVEGLGMAEIAEHQAVNLITARFQVENVLLKLGVASHGEAVAVALQHDLVL